MASMTILVHLLRSALTAAMLFVPAYAAALETVAPRAVVIEADSGSVLYARGEDQTFAPGNFAKLMTAAVVFDALANGEIRDDTVFTVSDHAWRTGGAPARVTTMFAKLNSKIAVGDLVKGLVVHYANDAAIALAEGISGSETAFARRMNETAERLQMTNSRFVNPTGYADTRARISLSDLAKLVGYLQKTHSQRYPLYGCPTSSGTRSGRPTRRCSCATSRGRTVSCWLSTRRPSSARGRLGRARGQARDGGGQRLPERQRAGQGHPRSRRRNLRGVSDGHAVPRGETVGTVRLFGGEKARVSVTGQGAVTVTLPSDVPDDFRARIAYQGPVPAPVTRGQELAKLEITAGDRLYATVPLVAAEDVPLGGLTDRARDGLAELLLGWW